MGVVPLVYLPLLSLLANATVTGTVLGLTAAETQISLTDTILYMILPHGIFEMPALFLSFGMGFYVCKWMTRRFFRRNLDDTRRFVDVMNGIAKGYVLAVIPLVTIAAIIIVVVVQVLSESLALSALCGVLVMILGGAIAWKNMDEQFSSGIRLMGMIAMIMLVAGGYAEVMKATNAVDALVEAAVVIMGGSKWIAACVITLIGLLVTMGIGSSFSTVPVLAVLYVPLCQRMGFSPAATILLMSAAAALGDAGSPASDTTLGPTSGLNADGQHDHIWDTCVPTFLHFNIPIMLVSIVMSQFI
jgi:predicted histidine transporter YuiF (NhaC family)